MSRQLLNLPINIPWKQIAVSPDMMDETFCNKLFPFAWRSSMAISVYEPKPEDLPEELCGEQISYIKVTTSITGYQPTSNETKNIEDILGEMPIHFPDTPQEDFKEAFTRITDNYFACYGVMLNVAVFPSKKTKTELLERRRIKFSEIEHIEPGSLLPNPFIEGGGIEFQVPGADNNNVVDIFPESGDGKGELDIQKKLIITIPAIPNLAAIEAKIVHYSKSVITMEAFKDGVSVGNKTTELEQGKLYTLTIEAYNIDKVIITAPDSKASLLEFAYFVGKEIPVELDEYPHIINFEPKRRDLYQASTESGEVLTGSKSNLSTSKTLTDTETSESSLDFGASAGVTVPIGGVPVNMSGNVSTSYKNTETDQDQWNVQTDASRERRETQGSNTQLSQMYNLLTGYHPGTNRASFLMLARPHTLQPTEFRTFAQGLRAIEGVQEFFLIVARPKDAGGLCIETSLETGHFPEDTKINDPENSDDVEYYEGEEEFEATGFADNAWTQNCESFLKEYTIGSGNGDWIIDRRASRGSDANHLGIAEIEDNNNEQANQTLEDYRYSTTTDISVEVKGRICAERFQGDKARFRRTYRVFTRSVEPKISNEESSADIGQLLITSRNLCVCYKSGECPEVIPLPAPPSIIIEKIVDEPRIRIDKDLIVKNGVRQNKNSIAKAFIQQVQNALLRSARSTSRHAFGDDIGFLESDYFKNTLKKLLPEKHLKCSISEVAGLPDEVVKALGDKLTIGEAIDMDLARFARRTGLNVKEASKVRHQLLGLPDESGDKNPTDADSKYSDNIK